MSLRRFLYQRVIRAEGMALRMGLNKRVGPLGRRLLNRADMYARDVLYDRMPNPCIMDDIVIHYPERSFWRYVINAGAYEPETTAVVKRLMVPGMTFIDVGAHVGYYTLLVARYLSRNGGGHVYAFEPDPYTAGLLGRNVVANECEAVVEISQMVVSDNDGSATLYVEERDRLTSSIFSEGLGWRSLTCAATRLDSFFEARHWPPVHLVKVDTEGAELKVLAGMAELARRNPGMKLIIEFFPTKLRSAGGTPAEFFSTLVGCGFTSVSVIDRDLEPVRVPDDVPSLTSRCGDGVMNLLCAQQI